MINNQDNIDRIQAQIASANYDAKILFLINELLTLIDFMNEEFDAVYSQLNKHSTILGIVLTVMGTDKDFQKVLVSELAKKGFEDLVKVTFPEKSDHGN